MTITRALSTFVRRTTIALVVFAPLVAFATLPAAAQTDTAAQLTGTVTDAAGKPLGDARITATGAGASRATRSGSDGRFSVTLAAGTYAVTVSANGYQTSRDESVVLGAGQRGELRFTLAATTLQTIGRISKSFVTSINTSAAATATTGGQTFVDQGQPQVKDVLDQIPGVEVNRASSNAPGANSSISIRGAQPYESQILIDGHPVVTSANGAAGFNATFINSLLLDDVQVAKGPGTQPNTIENAIGGTLNFRTAQIAAGPSASALVGYDSFNGDYYALKLSDRFGKFGVLLGVASDRTPGYLPPGATVTAGEVFPAVHAGEAFDPHVGVVDFAYPATQSFASYTQLGKISYDFSSQTSLTLSQYSTQTNNDETGTNFQYVDARIVPCIDDGYKKIPPAGTCGPNAGTPNYTSTANTGLIGSTVPVSLFGRYPNTTEFDNAPIYAAEFRTSVGPGSLLARYYTGAINRIITQNFAPTAVIPCSSPACPNGDILTTNPPTYNAYNGEPYVEDTIDVLHGLDAQYSVPFGTNTVTAGFDRHVDSATFGNFDPTEGPPSFTQNLDVQSLSFSLRGDFAILPKLRLETGNYLSSTTYVGSRFDTHDGLTYRVNPHASVRASYGTAYAAPYYNLINTSSYVDSGTLNLATGAFRPETSAGYDVGTDFNLGRDSLFSMDGYLNNIYNRYASVTEQLPTQGTFDGKNYTQITQNGNQANVREEGVEVSFLRSPRVGLGFHTAIDLLRDYAVHQDPTASDDNIFSGTAADGVQLPSYPYFKTRNDLFYSFGNGAQTRVSATSYGANNAYGTPGFTLFDGEIRLPLQHALTLNIGGQNLFNHDDYRAGAIYDGGYTFATLGGGSSYTTQFFTTPRTLFIQLQRSVGPNGTVPLPRSSL